MCLAVPVLCRIAPLVHAKSAVWSGFFLEACDPERTIAAMSKAVGVTGAVGRGVWAVGVAWAAMAWAAMACGDDAPATAVVGPGAAVEPDAGAPSEPAMSLDAGRIPERTTPVVLLPPARQNCVPGETRACQVDLLCSGLSTCGADGQAFGACDCGDGALLGTGIVGARCDADTACEGGALCMRADDTLYLGAGGPAGGYCTLPCADTADCVALDGASSCQPIGPERSLYCLRTCLSKEAEPGEAKCLNRTDVVCRSAAAAGVELIAAERQAGFCEPRCGSDSECPVGTVCRMEAGICATVQAPGAEVGSGCRLDTECQGRSCEDRVNEVGTCTSPCVVGSLAGCGYARDDSAREAACVTPVVRGGGFSEGPGDLGFCLEVCNVAADCLRAAEGFVCRPLNQALAEFFGRAGVCAPP